MAFPKTRDEMKEQGYIFSNHAQCSGCHQIIEWYETPKGKKMPMDQMLTGSSTAISHWSTCPNAPDFRRGK